LPTIEQQPLPEIKRYPKYGEQQRGLYSLNLRSGKRKIQKIRAKGSFDRDDLYWFTTFETLDGFFQNGGGMTFDSDGRGVKMTTAASTNDEQRVYKTFGTYAPDKMTWNKDRKIKFKFSVDSVTAINLWLGNGILSSATTKHIGIKLVDNALTGTIADGSTEATLSLGNITATTIYEIEIRLIAGVSVEFLLDGVSKGFIVTNLPTGSAIASTYLLWLSVTTTENVAKVLQVGYFETWQLE